MASRSEMLYMGVTNNLERRVYEHKHGLLPGFSKKYQTYDLVYYDCTGNIESAITREKQIKGWHRKWKINLIERDNPNWDNLLDTSYDPPCHAEFSSASIDAETSSE